MTQEGLRRLYITVKLRYIELWYFEIWLCLHVIIILLYLRFFIRHCWQNTVIYSIRVKEYKTTIVQILWLNSYSAVSLRIGSSRGPHVQ